jgi:hypothetical protein
MKMISKLLATVVLAFAGITASAIPVGPAGIIPVACEKKYAPESCPGYEAFWKFVTIYAGMWSLATVAAIMLATAHCGGHKKQ